MSLYPHCANRDLNIPHLPEGRPAHSTSFRLAACRRYLGKDSKIRLVPHALVWLSSSSCRLCLRSISVTTTHRTPSFRRSDLRHRPRVLAKGHSPATAWRRMIERAAICSFNPHHHAPWAKLSCCQSACHTVLQSCFLAGLGFIRSPPPPNLQPHAGRITGSPVGGRNVCTGAGADSPTHSTATIALALDGAP